MPINNFLLLYSSVFVIIAAITVVDYIVQASFADDFYITGGEPMISADGLEMQLVLDNKSASGFASSGRYLFGSIDMKMKLVPGDSAGTVTAYYLSSDVASSKDVHDEIDFEFLGNVSGQPYILQTNIFASGMGEREQRIYLWFDPSLAYHTYSVLWNPQHIILSVDGTPIRRFPNNEAYGLAYLNKQPMRIYASLWDGDTWATRGGLDKINWTHSPFITTFTGFHVEACPETNTSSCPMDPSKPWNQPIYQTLSSQQQAQLEWVQQNYMTYDYCTDTKRYPVPPLECTNSNSVTSSSSSSSSVATAPTASVSNSAPIAPSPATTASAPRSI